MVGLRDRSAVQRANPIAVVRLHRGLCLHLRIAAVDPQRKRGGAGKGRRFHRNAALDAADPVDAGAVAVEDGGERGALADEDRGGRRRQRKPEAGIADQDQRERRGAGVRRRSCGDRDRDAGCDLRARRVQHQSAGRLRRGDDERISADTRGQRCGYLDGICKPLEASDGDGHSRHTARLERQLSRHYRNRKRAFLRKHIAVSRRARTERHGGDEAAKN